VNYREDLQRRTARKGAFLCGNKNAALHFYDEVQVKDFSLIVHEFSCSIGGVKGRAKPGAADP
jgi:hypothetical protein